MTNATGEYAAVTAEHRRIGQLFRNFEIPENPANPKDNIALAAELREAVRCQLHLEEAVLFPKLRRVLADDGAIHRLSVQHSLVRYLVARLDAMPNHPLFDATVKVLGDCVMDHFRELDERFGELKLPTPTEEKLPRPVTRPAAESFTAASYPTVSADDRASH